MKLRAVYHKFKFHLSPKSPGASSSLATTASITRNTESGLAGGEQEFDKAQTLHPVEGSHFKIKASCCCWRARHTYTHAGTHARKHARTHALFGTSSTCKSYIFCMEPTCKVILDILLSALGVESLKTSTCVNCVS